MVIKELIEELIKEYITDNQLFLVDIEISRENDITVTIDSFLGIDIEHCVRISRLIEQGLNRDDEDFSLTVTSAGLDQPFKVPEQYIKFLGKEVDIILKKGTKIKGILSGFENNTAEISTTVMEVVPGKKRKVKVERSEKFSLEEIKATKAHITFK